MIESLVPIAGKKLGGYLASKFGVSVIERWTRHRAQKFFEAFCEEVALNDRLGAEAALDEILDSEKRTEALFDAYRAVALSRTKTVGPRAIGYLTARIVNENRTATTWEESWGEFFETASDVELIEAKAFYEGYLPHDGKDTDVARQVGDYLEIKWSDDHSNSQNSSPVDQTFNLHHIGTFAARLGTLGILLGSVNQSLQSYKEDGETRTEMIVKYLLTIRKGDFEFISIISRALRQP